MKSQKLVSRARRVPARPSRSDGDATREHILRTAGSVFAQRGYAQATSKEICERAQTNQAAVNYHFGSKDGLYEAVLVEAHRQVIDMEDLSALLHAPGDARERLGLLLERILHLATRKEGWAFPVLLREMMSPSSLMPAFALKAVRPKAEVIMALLAEVSGLPPGHASLQRCMFFCIVPCVLMAVAPQAVKTSVLPALSRDIGGFLEDMKCFAFAGIDAIAQQGRRRKPR